MQIEKRVSRAARGPVDGSCVPIGTLKLTPSPKSDLSAAMAASDLSPSRRTFGVWQALALGALGAGIRAVNLLAPRLAARLALQIFLTPPKYTRPAGERAFVEGCQEHELPVRDKRLRARSWGEGESVLLVHGWGGRGTQMGAFIRPLVDVGYKVIALDGPAHGDSTGRSTDCFEFAEAIAAAARAFEPVRAVIAHSFGAGCTMLAGREHGLSAQKIVLVSCFASPIWVTEEFARMLSLPDGVTRCMRRLFEARYRDTRRWEDLEITDMVRATTIPILLIHDTEDKETPYEHALRLAESSSACRLITTHGLGHRRILKNTEVTGHAVDFVKAI